MRKAETLKKVIDQVRYMELNEEFHSRDLCPDIPQHHRREHILTLLEHSVIGKLPQKGMYKKLTNLIPQSLKYAKEVMEKPIEKPNKENKLNLIDISDLSTLPGFKKEVYILFHFGVKESPALVKAKLKSITEDGPIFTAVSNSLELPDYIKVVGWYEKFPIKY